MARAYSQDLRERVLEAAAKGLSARQAAERFGVGVATAIVCVRRARVDGEPSARRSAIRQAIESTGARPLFLPPHSPDFNPIENAFSKLKALLRNAAARTVEDLWRAIRDAIDAITPTEGANFFVPAGHDPE